MGQRTIEEMCAAWLKAKAAEHAAAELRTTIEEQIVAVTGKRDEGAQTVDATGYKITVTGKITRRMDWKKWADIEDQIPPELRPIQMKPSLDETGVKWLQANRPELYQILPIEVKPAKTAVVVKAVEPDATAASGLQAA